MLIAAVLLLLFKATDLQRKIENAGGERLKNQKSKVKKIQEVCICIT